MMTRPSESDQEFETETVAEVSPQTEGWDVQGTSGWHLFVPSRECQESPAVGEEFRTYGKGIGFIIRGIVIGGRVYSYRTPEEAEADRLEQLAKYEREETEQLEAFRGTPLPPLKEFGVRDPEGWAACVKIQSGDPYSYACVEYAAAWAALMEAQGPLASDSSDASRAVEILARIAKPCSHEADTDGITGFMYGAAVSMLAKFWVYGDALRRWSNLDMQIGDEGEKANESGATLNPALMTLTAR